MFSGLIQKEENGRVAVGIEGPEEEVRKYVRGIDLKTGKVQRVEEDFEEDIDPHAEHRDRKIRKRFYINWR